MKKISFTAAIILTSVVLTGCTNKQEYYAAVQKANNEYIEAYKGVKNEEVVFDGTFKGKMTFTRPKKLPKLQVIQAPTNEALEWARTLVPAIGGFAGMYYGYKTADSSNRYNAQNIANWTGNFKNNTVTTNTKETLKEVNTQKDSVSYPNVNVKDNNVSIGQ